MSTIAHTAPRLFRRSPFGVVSPLATLSLRRFQLTARTPRELAVPLLDDAGGRFTIDAQTGEVRVADGNLLDFNSNASHTILVRVVDNQGGAMDKAMTVEVRQAPEQPGITGGSDGGAGPPPIEIVTAPNPEPAPAPTIVVNTSSSPATRRPRSAPLRILLVTSPSALPWRCKPRTAATTPSYGRTSVS